MHNDMTNIRDNVFELLNKYQTNISTGKNKKDIKKNIKKDTLNITT